MLLTPLRTVILLTLILGSVVVAHAVVEHEPKSGVQKTFDRARSLISKDVGSERWAITFNPDDQTATGNIFHSDGGEPSFVWCHASANDGTTLNLDCYGADKCPSAPCDSSEWTFIGNVPLPASFFLPPDSPPLASCPMRLVANGANAGSADSYWDCHVIGLDHTFGFQVFENGDGFSSDIGPFFFGATACGQGLVDSGAGNGTSITNIKGTRETTMLRFHQRGFGLDNDIMCGFVPL